MADVTLAGQEKGEFSVILRLLRSRAWTLG